MNHSTTGAPTWEKYLQPPPRGLDVAMNCMLKENQELQPQLLLMFEQAALMQREKHMAFVRAGFSDDQAFVLASK